MIKLIYTTSGAAFSDYMVEGILRMHDNYEVRVSTENMIHAARALYREGVIKDLEIWYEYTPNKHMKINIDKNGRLDQWPKGFCDSIDQWIERLI